MVLDKEEILQALKEIYDPEIPSGYRHLGLNYDIVRRTYICQDNDDCSWLSRRQFDCSANQEGYP
jgi:hypothetical protein